MLIVTNETIAGRTIKHSLGLVISVMEFRISRPTRAIYEAINAIISQAKARGANAITGFRLTSACADGVTSITAYGTAVVIEKNKEKQKKDSD